VPQVVAIISIAALVAFAGYQVVLLRGIPLARFAWGGEDHYLQPRHRPYALLAIVGCAFGIFIALQGANLFLVIPVLVSQIACYVVVVALFAAFILTARSRSLLERQVMLPFYVILSGLFLIIALAGHPPTS
jgi:uncharacterized membrane protein YphA (DoxX/SURF4 family)